MSRFISEVPSNYSRRSIDNKGAQNEFFLRHIFYLSELQILELIRKQVIRVINQNKKY
jgi:hypothetical protein